MRLLRSILFSVLLAASFAVGDAAFAAGKKPTDFKDPPTLSEEELADAKQRGKNRLNGFDEKLAEKPKETPWLFIGLVGITLFVASPFALRAYLRTTREIAPTQGDLPPAE